MSLISIAQRETWNIFFVQSVNKNDGQTLRHLNLYFM